MSASLRILVVDDEPDIVHLIAWHLRGAGHTVDTAADGWQALERVRLEPPELILLDLMLPDLDGFGVCEILRRDPSTATIPIVVLSAWSSDESKRLALELGTLDYIVKPFHPRELPGRIERFLGLGH